MPARLSMTGWRAGRILLAGAAALGAALVAPLPSRADTTTSEQQATSQEPPHQSWSFEGPFGTFDRASAQRGFQVWKEVCSNCHSMKNLYYRDLSGIGLNEEQIKAVAASVQVPGGVDDNGQPVERPGLPSDHFRSPFPNDAAARAANNGALPPDHTDIEKAREGGADYIDALLTGYKDPPAGVKVPDGQYYNPFAPGRVIAMAPPLNDGQVTYADGTKATVEQMARDVTQFLSYTANPELELRHRLGVKVILFLAFMTCMTYAVKRKIWAGVH